jgi:hypothetical protein
MTAAIDSPMSLTAFLDFFASALCREGVWSNSNLSYLSGSTIDSA